MSPRDDDVLRMRAEVLALPLEEEASAGVPVLVFRLGQEKYGLGLRALTEVIDDWRLTPIPGAIREVVGAINVRGEIRAVLDLALLLDFPEPSTLDGEILLLRREAGPLGLLVGAVDGLEDVKKEDLRPLSSPHLAGVTEQGLRVLDSDALRDHPLLRGRIS